MNRVDMLKTAIKLTQGDRQEEYGSFQKNMDDLAAMMDTYIFRKYYEHLSHDKAFKLNSVDAAFFMVLAKMTRTFQETANPKADTFVDGACYFAMAGEAAFHENS